MFKLGKPEIIAFAMYLLAATMGVFFGQFFHAWVMVENLSNEKAHVQKVEMDRELLRKAFENCTDMHRVYQLVIQELIQTNDKWRNGKK